MARTIKKRERDLKGVISRQKRYSTLAKQEGDYAKKTQRRERNAGKTEMARDSGREARIAYMFARKRRRIVAKATNKLRQLKRSNIKRR